MIKKSFMVLENILKIDYSKQKTYTQKRIYPHYKHNTTNIKQKT